MMRPAAPRLTDRTKLVLTSMVCAIAIGVVAALESHLVAGGGPNAPLLWWTLYAVFLATLLAIHEWIPRPRRLPAGILIVVLLLVAAALALLYAEQVWVSLIFLLTATMAAFFWPPSSAFVVIAVQTSLVVAMGSIGHWTTSDLVMATVGSANFQVFGVLLVYNMRREAEARRELAIAHTELRAAAAMLELTARDAERLRISRDIHDLTGHSLTALTIELEVALHHTHADPDAAHHHVERARGIAKNMLSNVRLAVGELRARSPSLESALRGIVAGSHGADISLSIPSAVQLDTDAATAVLRCVQEAITNVLRHSSASRVEVSLASEGAGYRLTVRDDGEGTDRIRAGNGLNGMRERIGALGGTLDAHSSPGAGFTVTAWLPRATDDGAASSA